MKKRVFSILVTVIMLITILPVSVFAAKPNAFELSLSSGTGSINGDIITIPQGYSATVTFTPNNDGYLTKDYKYSVTNISSAYVGILHSSASTEKVIPAVTFTGYTIGTYNFTVTIGKISNNAAKLTHNYAIQIVPAYYYPIYYSYYDPSYLQYLVLHDAPRYYDINYRAGTGGSIYADKSKAWTGESVTFEIVPEEGYEVDYVRINGEQVGNALSYTVENINSEINISVKFKEISEDAETAEIPEEYIFEAATDEEVKDSSEIPYEDIEFLESYYESIKFIHENEIFSGVTESEFAPYSGMTRGTFITALGRFAGINPDDYMTENTSFIDVSPYAFYTPYIEWAVSIGIVTGNEDFTFDPEASITVEEMYTIIYRYLLTIGVKADSSANIGFADSDKISPWAKDAVSGVISAGLVKPSLDKKLNPDSYATRADIAFLIKGIFDITSK